MRRFAVPGVITLIAVGLLAVLAFGVANQGTSTAIDGEVAQGHYPLAPDSSMALPVIGGSAKQSLAQLHGKVVLVNVFASWCVPCAQEAPVLDRAERMLQKDGGTVVGISYQDNAGDDVSFAHQYHVTYPLLSDASGNFVRAYGVTGVPETFVINRSGRIQALRRFQLTTKWVDQTLPKILGERS